LEFSIKQGYFGKKPLKFFLEGYWRLRTFFNESFTGLPFIYQFMGI